MSDNPTASETSNALDAALQAHFAVLLPGILVTGWTMTLRGTDGDSVGTYSISSTGQDHMMTWALAKIGAKIQESQMNAILMSTSEDEE